jgi:hypothetical protein
LGPFVSHEENKVFQIRPLNVFWQVDLLTSSEIFADSPEKIEWNIARILKYNSELAEAHFLAYLNCLRVNEYTGGWIFAFVIYEKHPELLGKVLSGCQF